MIVPTVSGEQFVEGLKVWLKMITNRETKLVKAKVNLNKKLGFTVFNIIITIIPVTN